jgi:CheY-like chemotaxis protein
MPETIVTDPLRLRQVLVNLVGNAIKFTDHGAVHLTAQLARSNGRLRLQFDVRDSGIGMDAQQLRRLFKPFSQVDSSPTRKFGGTGLGLCISRRLAESLGGTIAVQSALGKGSTFTLTIDPGPIDESTVAPCLQPVAASPRQSSSGGDEYPLRDAHILLAEDMFENQQLITIALRKAGAGVTAVGNGLLAVEAALAALKAGEPFDIVLMDMQMPVMDGYQAAAKLRAEGYALPIVALTANAMSDDSRKCFAAGCDAYAAKPVERATLLATLVPWLRTPQ